MSGSNFTLEGADNMIKVFREFPEEGYRKPIAKGFIKAAGVVAKAMKAAVPAAISPVKKAIKVKSSRRELVTGVGVFLKQGVYVNRRGMKWDPFQLGYWFNYGTYARRAASHQFVRARSKQTMDRSGGIHADLFIERGWESSKEAAAKELERVWAEETSKLCDKYGAVK
jgi:hypothetical protein